MDELKKKISENPILYAVIRKIYHCFVFAISVLAKFLTLLQTINGYIIAKLVFMTTPANMFYNNYYTDTIITEKLNYGKSQLKVRVNTYWDQYRIADFETYPVDVLIKDIEANTQNKKIVYYEVGANIGYSALVLADRLAEKGSVYALEVEPTNFKTLCDNIILNKIDNLVPFNLGVSKQAKVSKFYYNVYHTEMHKSLPVSGMGAHSLNFDQNLHDKKVYCNVPLIPLDTLISTFGLEKPTHVFIDTHGAELEVIESMSSTLVDDDLVKIMVDIEEEGIDDVKDSKIYKKLTNAGFDISHCETQVASGPFTANSHRTVFEKRK